MIKFLGLVVTLALSLGLSGHLKGAVMKMAALAVEAQQHQMSYAKFSRALTHCDLGTPEFATKACAESRWVSSDPEHLMMSTLTGRVK